MRASPATPPRRAPENGEAWREARAWRPKRAPELPREREISGQKLPVEWLNGRDRRSALGVEKPKYCSIWGRGWRREGGIQATERRATVTAAAHHPARCARCVNPLPCPCTFRHVVVAPAAALMFVALRRGRHEAGKQQEGRTWHVQTDMQGTGSCRRRGKAALRPLRTSLQRAAAYCCL